jgi:hypothetical protein
MRDIPGVHPNYEKARPMLKFLFPDRYWPSTDAYTASAELQRTSSPLAIALHEETLRDEARIKAEAERKAAAAAKRRGGI